MARPTSAPRSARGMTLIELVVAITIVAIAATAVLGAMSAITTRSADAMIQQQAVAVAQAYLEEVLQRPVSDPDGLEPEADRGAFDDVDDYNGLADTGAHDQFGNAIATLADYDIAVAVSQSAALGGVPAASARRVDVTVTHSSGVRVALSGYRSAY
jgi:MSHA pilin protein MshD